MLTVLQNVSMQRHRVYTDAGVITTSHRAGCATIHAHCHRKTRCNTTQVYLLRDRASTCNAYINSVLVQPQGAGTNVGEVRQAT